MDVDIAREVMLFGKNIYEAYQKASFELKRNILAFFWERFEIENHTLIRKRSTPLFQLLLCLPPFPHPPPPTHI